MYRMSYKAYHDGREVRGRQLHSFGDDPAFIDSPGDAEKILSHWTRSGWTFVLLGVDRVPRSDVPRGMNAYYEGNVIVWTPGDTRMLH